MLAKWLRNIIAKSLYKQVQECPKCQRRGGGFDAFETCADHSWHITFHNVLTSVNAR